MDTALYAQFAEIEREHWWFQGRRAVVAGMMRVCMGETSTARDILDVGCGTGEMTELLTEFGSVTALDMSEDAVGYCRRRFGERVDVRVGGLPEALPGRESVDVVAAFDVIEHLDDDVGALTSIAQILRPGGALVVTVPAYQFLWGPHDVACHHRRRYTRSRLVATLATAGFRIDVVSYFNTILLPIVAGVRLLRRVVFWKSEVPRSDFTMPPRLLNTFLLRVFSLERHVLPRRTLPAGVSLIAIARRTS